jgi:hypothetical protein
MACCVMETESPRRDWGVDEGLQEYSACSVDGSG